MLWTIHIAGIRRAVRGANDESEATAARNHESAAGEMARMILICLRFSEGCREYESRE